jgi:hypothetical protein
VPKPSWERRWATAARDGGDGDLTALRPVFRYIWTMDNLSRLASIDTADAIQTNGLGFALCLPEITSDAALARR